MLWPGRIAVMLTHNLRLAAICRQGLFELFYLRFYIAHGRGRGTQIAGESHVFHGAEGFHRGRRAQVAHGSLQPMRRPAHRIRIRAVQRLLRLIHERLRLPEQALDDVLEQLPVVETVL